MNYCTFVFLSNKISPPNYLYCIYNIYTYKCLVIAENVIVKIKDFAF